jgi:predicted transcriptional regulator
MRRDKLKIILDILDICNSSANKTKIVYRANLNFKMANLYLDIMTKEGLLEIDGGDSAKLYNTTAKGRELLSDVRQIYERLEQYSEESD